MYKRLFLLCLLLAGMTGAPLIAGETGPADTPPGSGQQPADKTSGTSGDGDKKPDGKEDEEPECD